MLGIVAKRPGPFTPHADRPRQSSDNAPGHFPRNIRALLALVPITQRGEVMTRFKALTMAAALALVLPLATPSASFAFTQGGRGGPGGAAHVGGAGMGRGRAPL